MRTRPAPTYARFSTHQVCLGGHPVLPAVLHVLVANADELLLHPTPGGLLRVERERDPGHLEGGRNQTKRYCIGIRETRLVSCKFLISGLLPP